MTIPLLDASRPRVCLSLTGGTLEEDLALLERCRGSCDLLELRLDLLRDPDIGALRAFPRRAGLPLILAARRRRDGGRFPGGEEERIALLRRLLPAGWALVDLEEDLPAGVLTAEAAAAGVGVLRSLHDPEKVPEDLEEHLSALSRRPGEIPRAELAPRGSRDLLRLFRAGLSAPAAGPRILQGTGGIGLPTRVLAGRLGSCLACCRAPGRDAAPGELDPATLTGLYRFRSLAASTPLYGVVGNPILHSRSPLLHNRGLAAAGLQGVYLPFQVDDLAAFFELAGLLGIRGLSVTLPHKEGVIPFLDGADREVPAIGACNTLLRRGEGWRGVNTDVEGFLAPLAARLAGRSLRGLGATVIGAGGAARAAVYALAREGARLLVLNRTVERARRLAAEFGGEAGGLERAELAGHRELIVQTTPVSMAAPGAGAGGDPLPGYRFTGEELVYDLVYTPPLTPFLRRAREAGCRIIQGTEMFLGQARAQFRLFTGRELPAEATDGVFAGLS